LFFVFQDLLKAVYKCPFHHDIGYKQGYLSPPGSRTHSWRHKIYVQLAFSFRGVIARVLATVITIYYCWWRVRYCSSSQGSWTWSGRLCVAWRMHSKA